MDEGNGAPAHSPPDIAAAVDPRLRRELLRPADARAPFFLAIATALLAGVLGGYVLRAATEPTPDAEPAAPAPAPPVISVPDVAPHGAKITPAL